MTSHKKYARLVREIEKHYGTIIDLKRSPSVIIEILREHGHIFVRANGGGGVSSVAIAGPGTRQVANAVILRAILKLQKEVKLIGQRLNRLAVGK